MSSIHARNTASLFAVSLVVSLGVLGCSSTSNDSGTGGTSSAALGGAANGGGSSKFDTGGSSTTSPTTSSPETGGSATGGKGSTGGTTATSSVHATGGALATGGSKAIGTSSAPVSGGTSSVGSTSGAGGNGGSTMTEAGGTRSGTGTGAQGGVASTQSTGGTTAMGAHTGGRAAGGGTNQGGATASGGLTALGGASGGGRTGTSSSFELTSTELVDGGTIPTDATCESTAASSLLPPLAWTGAPEGTKSFAMAFVDVTLIGANPPNANGFHSVMWDIPATVSSLPKGLPAGSPPAGIAGLETVKQKKAPSGEAWLGPCPNFPSTTRTKTDTYQFRLYALDAATLPSNTASMSVQQIYNYLESLPPLGVAVLSGTSNAAGTKLK